MAEASTSSDKPEFSLNFLTKLIPHEFDGNREFLPDFISNVNNAFALASDSQKLPLLYIVISKIRGNAKAYLMNSTYDSWEELKNRLKLLYQDKKHYVQLSEELANIKQGINENITNFYTRLDNLTAKTLQAMKTQNTDSVTLPGQIKSITETAMNRFIYHSDSHISQFLRWKEFSNINECFTAALAEEKAINMNKNKNYFDKNKNHFDKNNPNSSKKFCTNCKKNNHNTTECYRKDKIFTVEKFSPDKSLKFCKYCKKSGHEIQECRKLAYKNSQKNQENSNNKNLNSTQLPVADTEPRSLSNLQVFQN